MRNTNSLVLKIWQERKTTSNVCISMDTTSAGLRKHVSILVNIGGEEDTAEYVLGIQYENSATL